MIYNGILPLFLLVAPVAAYQGAIKHKGTNMYLSCDSSNCAFKDTEPTQLFYQQSGDDGQYKFAIHYASDNSDTGMCLDREHCHSSTSNSRQVPCSSNHCGAKHWNFDGTKIAEDHMKNCIQDNGRIGHCGDGYANIEFEDYSNCKIQSQTLSNLRCKSPDAAGSCVSTIVDSKSQAGAIDNQDCNNCGASGTLDCAFTFTMASMNGLSVTNVQGTKIGFQDTATIEAKLSIGIASITASNSYTFSVDHTWEKSKGTTVQNTRTVTSTCTSHIPAHHWERSNATFLTGTVLADFEADLTTVYAPAFCKDGKESVTGTLTVTNVPTATMVGSCAPYDVRCPAAKQTNLVEMKK